MTARKNVVAVSGHDNAAIAAERIRIAAILESPEGKRNPAMANRLALYSSLDAETARGILADAPAANPFLEAMDREGAVGIGAPAIRINEDPREARLKEIKESVKVFNAARRGKQAG